MITGQQNEFLLYQILFNIDNEQQLLLHNSETK